MSGTQELRIGVIGAGERQEEFEISIDITRQFGNSYHTRTFEKSESESCGNPNSSRSKITRLCRTVAAEIPECQYHRRSE